MPTFALVLPIELILLALHTSVFYVAAKLAYQGDKYKVFYVLYSLQNFSELLAYFSVTYTLRLPLMGAIQPSMLENTLGMLATKSAYFCMYYLRAAHFTIVLDRCLAIIRPELHKWLKSSTNAALPVCFAAISSLISAMLNSLDETIYMRAGDRMRLVPRSEAMHVISLGYLASTQITYIVTSVLLEYCACMKRRKMNEDMRKRRGSMENSLLVFATLQTITLAIPMMCFLIGFVYNLQTGSTHLIDLYRLVYTYAYGMIQMSSSLCLFVTCASVRSKVLSICRVKRRAVQVETASSGSRWA